MSSKAETILQLPPDALIEREGWNVRLSEDPDNIAHIAGLAESIFNVGVLEPLTAYLQPGDALDGVQARYVVTNGHCRLAAVRQALARGAPIKTLPVRLESKKANEADYTFSMIARNTGKALSQLELGQACKRLAAFGWTEADLAAKSGYSLQHVRNVLTLASAPVEIAKLVETGQVSASLATQAIAAEGNDGAAETLQAAVQIAKEEEAAKPKKSGKLAKATLKHVAKVKGTTRKSATKATYNKRDKNQLTPAELTEQIAGHPPVTALMQFDALVKLRAQVFEVLLAAYRRSWDAPDTAPADLAGNAALFALGEVTEIFARAVADEADDNGIVTVVLSAEDWEKACGVLKVKRSVAEAL